MWPHSVEMMSLPTYTVVLCNIGRQMWNTPVFIAKHSPNQTFKYFWRKQADIFSIRKSPQKKKYLSKKQNNEHMCKKYSYIFWSDNKDVCNVTEYIIIKDLLFLQTISIPRVSPTFLIYEAIMSGEFWKAWLVWRCLVIYISIWMSSW